MAERHAEILARIASVEQLQAIVTAMRGIAASRVQRARSLLPGIDAYAGVVAEAIAAIAMPDGESAATTGLTVAFCAEQGFAGAFSERVLEAAGTGPVAIVGTRGEAAAHEHGITPVLTMAMANHIDTIPALATALLDAILRQMPEAGPWRLDLVYACAVGDGIEVERRRVLPLDPSRFPATRTAPPLTTLPPAALLDRLAEEYFFAELCGAAMHAFAAENAARLFSMAAARGNIERRLDTLSAAERSARQSEITAEITELVAGAEATRG
ncbi:F0F1 ATP synthase subunit gamma [Acuticoccus kandeliae]|uniref:F0F1 ATP synthase subunit gamma n=1 Tax=Acuticoccus kandeliae TaxID=2073160 RepID=UPI000D3E61D7|nr:FoF1 ATP synthase subunit gamma [Acuticoccus kandeliae]